MSLFSPPSIPPSLAEFPAEQMPALGKVLSRGARQQHIGL